MEDNSQLQNGSIEQSSIVSSSQEQKNRKVVLLILIGGICTLAIISLALFMLGQQKKSSFPKTIATRIPVSKTDDTSPRITVLATLPKEDPAITYNMLLDPQANSIVYSIDKYLYTASSSSTIVINRKVGKTYDEISDITTSKNGKTIAFIAKDKYQMFVVTNGVEGKKYDYIKNLRVSEDGMHVAYAAGEGKYLHQDSPISGEYMTKAMFIVKDTIEGKKYDGTYVDTNIEQSYDPVFSKDGKKITYIALKNNKNIVVVDEKEFSEYPNQEYPKFVGNSYDLAYLVPNDNNYFLIISGEKKAKHSYISDVNGIHYFLKDTTHYAYEAVNKDVRTVEVNDSAMYPIFTGVLQDFVFSPSGKNFAYYTGTITNTDLSINGKYYTPLTSSGSRTVSQLVFTPDEKYILYIETDKQNTIPPTLHIIQVDQPDRKASIPLSEYKNIIGIAVSNDGKRVEFKALRNRDIVFTSLSLATLIPKE